MILPHSLSFLVPRTPRASLARKREKRAPFLQATVKSATVQLDDRVINVLSTEDKTDSDEPSTSSGAESSAMDTS